MGYQRMGQMPLLQGDIYWLAEPQTGLLQTLYQCEPEPDPVQLFEGTAFAAQASQSPILFKLSSSSGGMLSVLADDPRKYDGLLVASCATRAELLYHLRSLLEASFLQKRKALLRYYDPRVASYLLPTCTGALQARWLGPVSAIAWFGGTWADEAEGRKEWHLLTHDNAVGKAVSDQLLALDDEQLQRLVDQGYEYFAWRWLQQRSGYPVPQVLDWVRAGVALGHNEQNSLNAWLDSRVVAQGEQQG